MAAKTDERRNIPTGAELTVLVFAQNYGPLVDYGGAKAPGHQRKAAQACLEAGWLSGELRSASITDAGRAAVTAAVTAKSGGAQ